MAITLIRAASGALPVLTAMAIAVATPAHAQVSFSIDWNSPTRSAPDSVVGFPITDGDILSPFGGLPAMPLLPGALPPPAILISGGFGPPAPGLGLALHGPCAGMPPGVLCPIEVDAVSYGLDPVVVDFPEEHSHWYFSVDAWSLGVLGTPIPPAVWTESGGIPGALHDAAADVFVDFGFMPPPPIPPGFVGGNHGEMDGDGRLSIPSLFAYPGWGGFEPTVAYPGPGPTPGDTLDALDFDGAPFPQAQFPVFFSLDSFFPDLRTGAPNSGSAAAHGFAGGDIVVTFAPGGPPALYAPSFAIGLDRITGQQDTDDLDALVLAENGFPGYQPSMFPFDWLPGPAIPTDMLLFSVRAGSALCTTPGVIDSIFGVPIEPGDILTTPLIGGASPFPGIFIPAEALGLATARMGMVPFPFSDDLDALDYRREPVLLDAEYCYGDGGAIPGCTPCPCGNNMPAGTQAGCMNFAGTGCRLFASGFASVGADTLTFDVKGAQPMSFGLLFAADNRLPNLGPCPPGSGIAQPIQDGLRCIGQNLLRHGVRAIDAAGDNVASWGPGLIAAGGYFPGQTRQWQVFYRDVVTPACNTGINTSSAVQVTMTL